MPQTVAQRATAHATASCDNCPYFEDVTGRADVRRARDRARRHARTHSHCVYFVTSLSRHYKGSPGGGPARDAT